ncbi:MAG: PKD domain-containing protein, partial [Candidatus Aureabacteria bacterium]|nr:PKD domain-containing protein [Candidatus Auribacterota bacterium]
GPGEAAAGSDVHFGFTATDPDEDTIKFHINWGDSADDDITGSVVSGGIVNVFHNWASAGDYTISAITEDSNGAKSGYTTKDVTIVSSEEAATITIAVAEGAGSLKLWVNDVYQGNTTSTATLEGFLIGNTYKVEAVPDEGYVFDKLHWSGGIESGWTLDNPYTSTIPGADTSVEAYFVVGVNQAPEIPGMAGPDSGVTGQWRAFAAWANDPEGDNVKYTFDWGDESLPEETGYFASGDSGGLNHSWDTAGTYTVKVKATDSNANSSDYNSGQTITITAANTAPTAPTITGPDTGAAETDIYYEFTATDPDGDTIRFNIDWGDGNTDTTGYLVSGGTSNQYHAWASAGTYTITATTEDSNGAESGSTTKTVEISAAGEAATITIAVAEGEGSLELWVNDEYQGNTTSTTTLEGFLSGDTYKVEAVPADGYFFKEIEYQPENVFLDTNPRTGTLVSGSNTMSAYFIIEAGLEPTTFTWTTDPPRPPSIT